MAEVKSSTAPKTRVQKNSSGENNKKANNTNTTNATNKPEATKTEANNHDMKSKQLSEREKEIQSQVQNGEIDIKAGDKVGNYARALADKDGDGELSEAEQTELQATTKALLEKNPALAELARQNGLDPNNPEDLDAIMQLKVEDSGMKAGQDKMKVPGAEEIQQAQEAIDEANDELPPPENVDAPHQGANCNTPHEPDIISQISKLIQEAYQDLQQGDNQSAIQKFSQAISMGTEQLQRELNGGGQPKDQQNAIIDPANPNHLKQPGALNEAQQNSALNTLVQNDQSGVIKQAMEKAKENPRIQKLLDLIAYAQKGLEKAQQGDKNQAKMQTGGDPKAQQGLMALNGGLNIPQFKPMENKVA
jgi:hypothetical protein